MAGTGRAGTPGGESDSFYGIWPGGAGYFPRGVEECRRGKATNPPRWIMNPLNMLITRIGSRRATPQSVLHKYDDAHAAIRRLPRWSPGRRMEQGSEASWCI